MDQLIDFEIRYNEYGEPLCQGYSYVNTSNEHLCTRKADSVSFDINKFLYDNIGIKTKYDCCMFCKQHAVSITKKIIMHYSLKMLNSSLKGEIGNMFGIPDWNVVDYSAYENATQKLLVKDGRRKKKRKSKKRK